MIQFAIAAAMTLTSTQDQDAVLDVIDRFFVALERADTAAFRQMVDEDTLLRSLRRGADGGLVENTTPRDDWLAGLEGLEGVIVELYWDPKVEVSPIGLATAWVSYVVEGNGERAHCGVDAFTFVKRGDEWVITGLTDTRDPGGCERLGLEGAREDMRPVALRAKLKN